MPAGNPLAYLFGQNNPAWAPSPSGSIDMGAIARRLGAIDMTPGTLAGADAPGVPAQSPAGATPMPTQAPPGFTSAPGLWAGQASSVPPRSPAQTPVTTASSVDPSVVGNARPAPTQPQHMLGGGFWDYVRANPQMITGLANVISNRNNRGGFNRALEQFMALQAPPSSDPTSLQREYAQAVRQGFQGSILDYDLTRRRAGATQVNVGGKYGTIPSGYRLVEQPDGSAYMEPIAGGPAADEQEEARQQALQGDAQRQATADLVTGEMDYALQQLSERGDTLTGPWSIVAPFALGSDQHDFSQTLDAIKANIGFDKLQAMREASPTGGALGAVSDRENTLLQSVFGALSQSQSKEQLARNLRLAKETYLRIVHFGIPDSEITAIESRLRDPLGAR